MKFFVAFVWVVILSLFASLSYGQGKTALLKIRFEKPDLQAGTVQTDRGQMRSLRVVMDSSTIRTDSAGITIYSFTLQKPAAKSIMFYRDTSFLVSREFFLRPGDVLSCAEKEGTFVFEGEGKAAQLHRFLDRNGIFGEDSLLQKPLMRKVTDELYANFMRDIADEKWHFYQTTLDTTDISQNVFVKAALEAQYYRRVQFFQLTKDWTEEMFHRIKDRIVSNGRFMIPNTENTYRPSFRVVRHEDALLSRDYQFCLTNYLGGEVFFSQRNNPVERITAFYDAVDRELSQLPITRETLIASQLRFNFQSDPGAQALLERFERDFPQSKHLKEVRYAQWSMQKLKAGATVPPVPLLKSDSTQAVFAPLKGIPTLMLIWNTWEDSCQAALSSVAALAKKYDKTTARFATVCVRNRFDSWKEVLTCHWPNHSKEAHLYADYPETAVLEGVFTKHRPKLIVMDKEGRFVEEFSPFETEKLEKWLKK